jgi:O-methyltransferase involved in polyketide biosynthesis
MEQPILNNRNFSTNSPSAKSLLLMKGYTNIPFARQAAELIEYPKKYIPDFSNNDMTFWAKVVHFENRYWSINQLLEDLSINNILELSSGFSFRGPEVVKKEGFHYIDTDLPDVISTKKEFITAIFNESYIPQGKLELLPLNALDEKQFHETVTHFPKGEIAIINEGLLMYLDTNEKENLCNIIHKILRERGGCWITADIYLKKKHEKLNLKIDDKTKEFYKQHRLEDNKFESFEEARMFFKKMGFVIDKEATVPRSQLSSIKYLHKNASPKQLLNICKAGKIQATWRLRIGPEES